MRPRDVQKVLKVCLRTRQPLWIHGEPGCGKTAIVRETGAQEGYEVPHFPPAVTLDPVDLRGLPFIDQSNGQRMTGWAVPDFWPTDPAWKGIIFVDELPQAPPLVQSSFMQLVYGGRLGSYRKPDDAVFVVCGNRDKDRAGTHRVITPLLNRFMHIDMDVSVDDWRNWALRENIHSHVLSFINFRGDLLSSFKPEKLERSFPTPRAWEFVSNLLHAAGDGQVSLGVLSGMIEGCVGPAASEFIVFRETHEKLPEIKSILSDPGGATIPSDPSIRYALVGSLVAALRDCKDDATCAAIATYGARLGNEMMVLLMRQVLHSSVYPGGATLPEVQQWITNNRDILLA